jgi:hypothetical protein
MAARYLLYVDRQDENGKVLRQYGKAEFSADQRQFIVSSQAALKKWQVVFDLAQVAAFEILTEKPRVVYGSGGGGLLGMLIMSVMSNFIQVPIIRLEQETPDATRRWAKFAVRAYGGAYNRKATRQLALALQSALTTVGYRGLMPDLSEDSRWQYPWAASLATTGIVLVLTCICVALIVMVSNQ